MYFAEHLPRVNTISIVVELPSGFIPSKIHPFSPQSLHLIPTTTDHQPIEIKLPISIPQNNELKISGLKLQNQTLSFSILLQSTTAITHTNNDQSVSEFMNLQQSQKWSCKDLQSKTPNPTNNSHQFEFICSNCDAMIIDSAKYLFMDMPSEYWYELMDFWHCHKPDHGHTGDVVKDYEGVLKPNDDRSVIIGNCYFLQLCNEKLEVEGDEVRCERCKHRVGEKYEGVFKLYKWRLKLKYTKDIEVAIEKFDSKLFIYNSIIDKINSLATRRFKFKMNNDKWKYLWVMNLGLDISLDENVHNDALKVLIADDIDSQSQDSYEVMDIPYPDIAQELINHLLETNSKLPKSINSLSIGSNTFLVSYYVSNC
ncbi:uncharacterized protein J8A68_005155 [[Candida] subhashii]|uniref:Ubiquitin-conjugating enzyme E2-binding protein n=1 Tax=[Candida] subhashii TaxID=561895 RepID=A0A8J5QFV4_9ASCO|nr:uncharacterized protein J8A68_005155 [[Candida] subhashii]KAG7661363.1 hypothetical protein J8A68_005155 [[Candida] subhashii]